VLRQGYKEKPNRTCKDIEEERKQAMISDMTKKFGNVVVGIHGQELPKFNETDESKRYWELRKEFNKDPKNVSLRLLQ
jgi:hypothetical protein